MFLSQVIGNQGADASIQTGENDRKYVTFSVAHTELGRDSDGKSVEYPVWISVSWGNYTDRMLACLKKGTKVFVQGRTKVKVYNDNSGNPQPVLFSMRLMLFFAESGLRIPVVLKEDSICKRTFRKRFYLAVL